MSDEPKKDTKFKKKNQTKKYYNLVKYDMYTYDLKEITVKPNGSVSEKFIGNPDILQHLLNRLNHMVRGNLIEAYEYGPRRPGTDFRGE